MEPQQHHRNKHRRNDEPGGIGKLTRKGDGGHEAPVPGFVDQRSKQHQQAGHDQKHGHQRK